MICPSPSIEARDVLKCRIADKPNRILYSEKIGIYKQTARFLRLSDVERRVQDGVEQLNRTILEKNIAEIFDGLFDSQGGINPFTLYDTGEKILQSFVFVLEKIGIESQVSGDMKREVEGQLDFCITPSQYISRLIGLMVEQLRGIEETRRQTEYKPIRQAKDYIEQNYMSPISLEDLAEKVGLNPAYLSVLFKKETGSNYKDYLVQYRMKIAQTLLKDTNDTIAQIAHKTGYRDARHFSKTFDRVIGIKPNAYRKIYG